MAFLGLLTEHAHATLGEHESSISRDRRKMRSANHQMAAASAPVGGGSFIVHDISTDYATIKEYVNNDGKVFAVTWKGAANPDLTALFGSYYTDYRNVASNTRIQGQRNQRFETSDLTVITGGHQRAVTGKAYISKLLPAGVTPGDLQ